MFVKWMWTAGALVFVASGIVSLMQRDFVFGPLELGVAAGFGWKALKIGRK